MANEQTYQSEFTGQQMDQCFAAVAELTAALEALTAVVAGKYVKPADGIPSSDMTAAVQASLAKAESAVQSLADYYTKTEVDQLLAAINGMDYVDVSTLPTASASTMGKIYLVGPDASGYYSYYYTSYNGSAYSWVGPLGTTQISLANYATKTELSQLDQEVNGYIWTEGKYLKSTGAEDTDPAWGITDYIPYAQGNDVIWKWGAAAAVASGRTINFYRADKTYISNGYWSASGTSGQKTITAAGIAADAPAAAYIRASFKLGEGASVTIGNETAWVQGGGLAKDVEENAEAIATLYDALSTEVTDPFSPSPTPGTYWTSEGAQGSSENWESYQIDLSQYVGKTITFKVHGQSGAVAYSFIKNATNDTIWSESVGAADYEHSFLVDPAMKTLLVSNRKTSGAASFFVTYEIIAVPEKTKNNLSGKTVSFLGDSITYGSSASDNAHRFSTLFCAKYGAVENNLGVTATGIANNMLNGTSEQRFVTRATQANLQDSKLIVVFGGTNDFSYDSKAIGDLFAEETITSDGYIGTKQKVAVTDTDTFAGALHDLISTIRTNCPNVPIVFLTPLKRGRYTSGRPTSYESNQWGDYLDDFCVAIKEICAYYSIPVLDLNAKSELDFSNASIATMYSSDSLHPNDAGHAIRAEILYRFVEDNVVIITLTD